MKVVIQGATLQGLGIVLMFVQTVLLSRLFGISGFGEFTMYYSVGAISMVLSTFGTSTLILREIPLKRELSDVKIPHAIFFFSILAHLILSLLILCCLYAYINSSKLESLYPIGEIVFFSFSYGLNLLANARLMALGEKNRSMILELILPMITFLPLVLVLAYSGVDLNPANCLALLGLSYLIFALYGVFARKVELNKNVLINIRVNYINWLRYSTPFLLTNLFASMQQNLLVLIIGSSSGHQNVAIYRVAERLSSLALFAKRVFEKMYMADISRLWGNNEHEAIKMKALTASRSCFGFVLMAFSFYVFFGEYFIRLLYGLNFDKSLNILIIIVSGHLAAAFFGSGGTLLAMTSYAASITKVMVLTGSLMLVTVYFVAINFNDISTIAFVVSLFIVITQFLLWYFALKNLKVNTSIVGGAS